MDFIDEHRGRSRGRADLQGAAGCHVGITTHAAQRQAPELRCARAQRDDVLVPQIKRVWQANMQVYGADKVWQQLGREGAWVARGQWSSNHPHRGKLGDP